MREYLKKIKYQGVDADNLKELLQIPELLDILLSDLETILDTVLYDDEFEAIKEEIKD